MEWTHNNIKPASQPACSILSSAAPTTWNGLTTTLNLQANQPALFCLVLLLLHGMDSQQHQTCKPTSLLYSVYCCSYYMEWTHNNIKPASQPACSILSIAAPTTWNGLTTTFKSCGSSLPDKYQDVPFQNCISTINSQRPRALMITLTLPHLGPDDLQK